MVEEEGEGVRVNIFLKKITWDEASWITIRKSWVSVLKSLDNIINWNSAYYWYVCLRNTF